MNKFYHDLKSQGIRCGKNTLHEYLGYLSDAYLFFQVYVHTNSERIRMVNPRKIYAIDTGLIHTCSRSIRSDWGHLLENFEGKDKGGQVSILHGSASSQN